MKAITKQARPGSTIALALVSANGWLSASALPYEISGLASHFSTSLRSASWICSVELFSLALAVMLAERVCQHLDLRPVIGFAAAGAVAAGLLSMTTHELGILVLARVIFGASTGVAGACANALASRYPDPERIFAYFLIALCPVLACLMIVVPALDKAGYPHSLFIVETAMTAGLGALTPWLPALPAHDRIAAAPVFGVSRRSGYLLAGLAFSYVAQAIVWGFAEDAGRRLGVEGTFLGALFTISAFGMIPGAAIIAALSKRAGHIVPAIFCYGAFVAIAISCYELHSAVLFSIAIASFNGVAALLLPVIQAALAEQDQSGRGAALSIGAINFGAAAGPLLGSLPFLSSGPRPIGMIAVTVFVLSAIFVLCGLRASKARHYPTSGRSPFNLSASFQRSGMVDKVGSSNPRPHM